MEADWSMEIGGGSAVLEPLWPGFVDLRQHPSAVWQLSEVQGFPPLGDALLQWNASPSPFWTSKCDVWTLSPEQIDPFEFDATPETAQSGLACYVDCLLVRQSATLNDYEQWARALVAYLHQTPFPCARIDAVVRAADFAEQDGFGLTLYCATCGATPQSTREQLASLLLQLSSILILPASKLGKSAAI